ncbi:aminoglycoside 6-adenylyltransferase [Legionella oakridgensis]|nr:aminoglycoside 6-adenylyltransferase [Legionella oakridgensis]
MTMKNRRDEKTMLNLIVQAAKNDKRIRAVIMNGSRASPSAKKDIFQDYDIVYLVTDVEPFVDDKNWVRHFGELLIMQMPEEMDGNWPRSKDKYVYLMQFKDWNRIDLTLLHINRLKTMPRDSQSILLLDKDQLIESFDPSDNDYLPKPPTAKDYFDCCNEFLWVSTYVAKGLWRKQITYTKHVSEQVLKEELIRMLTWYIGIQTGFNKSLGVYGKYIENYLEPKVWQTFLQTYVDADFKNMWASLFKMCELFYDLAIKVSHYFGFPFNGDEFENVMAYLHEVKDNMYQHE